MDDDLAFISARKVEAPPARDQDVVIRSRAMQLEFFEPEEITRPELNIAKYASMIFTSPYGAGKYEVHEYTWKVNIQDQKMDARITIRPGHDLKT